MTTEQFTNEAYTTLNGGIDALTQTVVVADASSFPLIPQFRTKCDNEYMLVTGVSGNTLTVDRGTEGSTAVSHLNGETIVHILTAGAISQLKSDIAGSGPQGYQGNTGYQGFQGNTGPQGYQGGAGSSGAQGSFGTQGYQGLVAGWNVICDVNFTAQSNQTLSPDGDYTIGGLVFTKALSSEESTDFPWAIVSGSGLRVSGLNSRWGVYGFQNNAYRTAQLYLKNPLFTTLSGVASPRVRLSAIIGVSSGMANPGGLGIGLFGTNDANSTSSTMSIGHTINSSAVSTQIIVGNDPFGSNEDITSTVNPTYDTVIMDCLSGLLGATLVGYRGQASGSTFPSMASCQAVGSTSISIGLLTDGYTSLYSADTWRAAVLCGHSSHLSYTYVKRFKIEVMY